MKLIYSTSNSPDLIKRPQSRYVAFSGYMEVDEGKDILQESKKLRDLLKGVSEAMDE